MQFSDMTSAINRRIDDTINTNDAVEYLNSAQNAMALDVEAKFTQLTATNTATFDFDEKYHEIPILYAVARFKQAEGLVSEAQYYFSQYEQLKKLFVANYQVPPSKRDDRVSQQFTAASGQQAFVITKNGYNPTYGDLVVYKNDKRIYEFSLVNGGTTDEAAIVTTTVSTNDSRGFILDNACTLNDKITAVWEEHTDLIDPPYSWWANGEW